MLRLARLVTLLLVVPLAASDPSNRCDAGQVCVFEQNAMRGAVVGFTVDDASYGDDAWRSSTSATADDSVSSIANATDRWVVFHVDPDHRGHALCVGPQAFVDDLEAYEYDAFGHTYGDAISSHELRSSRPRPSSRGGPCDHTVTGDSIVGGGGWDRSPAPGDPAPACAPRLLARV